MILDPDAEQLVIDYLATEMPKYGNNTAVSGRPPQDLSDAVTVLRTGGSRRDLVTDQAQITIDSRAGRDTTALDTLRLVRALMDDAWGKVLGGQQVYDVNELSGPYRNPTDQDLNRYSQSFLVAVRATQIATL